MSKKEQETSGIPAAKVHLMIDLETLGTTPNSVILSIGAVPFFSDNVVTPMPPTFLAKVSIGSSLMAGMDIDPKTVEWWKSQPDNVKNSTFECCDGISLKSALEHLSFYYKAYNAEYVWGNGADFDISLLRRAYDLCKLPVPWSYKNVRCYRTIVSMFGDTADFVKPKIPHDPIEDAIAQILTLKNVLKHI